MEHYICTGGCGGESGISGVCQAEGCKKEGEPLTRCTCEDGLHEDHETEESVSEDLK